MTGKTRHLRNSRRPRHLAADARLAGVARQMNAITAGNLLVLRRRLGVVWWVNSAVTALMLHSTMQPGPLPSLATTLARSFVAAAALIYLYDLLLQTQVHLTDGAGRPF